MANNISKPFDSFKILYQRIIQMPNITSDMIRDIAVTATEMFLNKQVPLSDGLAKLASFHELNSEQTKRAMEATNQICFMKSQEVSGDKTIEFPLATYPEIMSSMMHESLTKAAAYNLTNTGNSTELTKEASVSVSPTFILPELTENETVTYFIKMAAENEKNLAKLEDREFTIVPELEKVAKEIKKDKLWLEKLSFVTQGCEFRTLGVLISDDVPTHKDTGFFKEAELKQVKTLQSLYKEAQNLSKALLEKKELQKRAGLFKEAMLIKAADGTKDLGQAAVSAGAKINSQSIAAKATQNVGYGIGKVVGGVATAPFKLAAPVVKNVASRLGGQAANVGRSLVGAEKVTLPKKLLGIGALGAAAGHLGNAAIYNPGTEASTGSSKDVWDALQRQ